jgi:tripartite ATP-independent transporter DctM subunit
LEAITIAILVIAFVVMLLLEVPISFAIGVASFLALLPQFSPFLAAEIIAQKTVTAMDNFGLLAIPFFILTGNIMTQGGIAQRLVDVAKVFVGRMPGALAHCTVVGNALFGAISGSAVSSAAAVGGIMNSVKEREKYDPSFLAAVNIASSPTGLLIPPSGSLILYSLVSGGTSVIALFMAGYIPGMLMGLSVMIGAGIMAWRQKMPKWGSTSFSESIKILWRAIPSLFLVVVVIGGIIKGIYTASEAAAVSVVYSLVLSYFYKELKKEHLVPILKRSVMTTCVVLFMVATSMALSWVMSMANIPEYTLQLLKSVSDNPIVVLLMINVILLVLGTFMDITPGILIFTPIFLPVVKSFGMHPVHFGIVMVFNLCIGIMTPPVGSTLFVGCGVAGVPLKSVLKYLNPLFIGLVIMLLVVTYFPSLSLWLPKTLGLL